MNKLEIARRRFAGLTDTGERLNLAITARLGEELVEMLPALIELGGCSFENYNSPCEVFALETQEPDIGGLFVYLTIENSGQLWSINFSGLMTQFANADKAADIVASIIRTKFCDGLYHEVKMTSADVCALRTHSPASELRPQMELSAFYHALKSSAHIELALRLLPEYPSNYRVPTEQRAIPIVEHLRSVGVEEAFIEGMLLRVFQNTESLVTLDKVVALAGAYQSTYEDEVLSELLQCQLGCILALHFAGDRFSTHSAQMSWLVEHGLFNGSLCGSDSHPQQEEFDAALIEVLSQGKLAAVYQFLTKFVMNRRHHRFDQKVGAEAVKQMESLLAPAFKLAMDRKNYGCAAAIAQISPNVSEADRLEALEMALIYNKPIRVQWAYMFVEHETT